MRFHPLLSSTLRGLLLAGALSAGLALAQQEPTMGQIYAAAQSGKLDQAQVMLQQVLVAHPKSAKAHFVQAELFARQGNLPKAREALASAEALAPGLPFAKPEAVQALQKQLSAPRTVTVPATATASYETAPASAPGRSWLLPAALAALVIGGAFFVFRRKAAPARGPGYGMGNGGNGESFGSRIGSGLGGGTGFANSPGSASGLSGPQSFGAAAMQPAMQGGYGQPPAYAPAGQPGYAQAATGSGLGGKIMGGVATGLAVGAGVMAAQAIGRNLMGNSDTPAHGAESNASHAAPSDVNTDMGGQNFGVSDTGWDDGGLADGGLADMGGDWDT